MVFWAIFFVLLLLKVELVSCVIVKVPQDISLHNQVYVTKLADIFQIEEKMCSYNCDLHTKGKANLRRYNRKRKSCECFFATEDFRDSREIAPEVHGYIFLANPKLFEKKPSLVPCNIQITAQHALQLTQAHDDDVTKDECLEKVAGLGEDKSFAVYCEEKSFCGWNLQPNATESLKYLTQKICQVFVNNVTFCEDFHEQLVQADVDECLRVGDELCGNNTGDCVNVVNRGYECSCYSGHEIVYNWEEGTVHCEDINECSLAEDVCPGPFDYCLNGPGNFTCPCESSRFERISAEYNCSDVDECQTICVGEKYDNCTNSIGFFSCSCNSGFESDSHTGFCVDIDECEENIDGCEMIGNTTCLNVDGTFYCVPQKLDSLQIETYTSEGYLPFHICTEDPCVCDDHYMWAILNDYVFCMNTFFSQGGVHDSYPVCSASCCNSFCGWVKPVGGFSSSVLGSKYGVEGMWDSTPDDKPSSRLFHSESSPQPHWIDLELGGVFSVNSVSLMAHWRSNAIQTTVAVCKERNVDCVLCGTVLEANTKQWTYVLCQEQIAGTWIRMENHVHAHLLIFEILIHYTN